MIKLYFPINLEAWGQYFLMPLIKKTLLNHHCVTCDEDRKAIWGAYDLK